VIIKCYVFNDRIFDCGEEDDSSLDGRKKSTIILDIQNVETGESYSS